MNVVESSKIKSKNRILLIRTNGMAARFESQSGNRFEENNFAKFVAAAQIFNAQF